MLEYFNESTYLDNDNFEKSKISTQYNVLTILEFFECVWNEKIPEL